MPRSRTYADKRAFEETPEPQPEVEGNVDPTIARPGNSFVIHQHHATRLHFDLRLEMFNGKTPVLVSWAVPKNLPRKKGKPHLAVHVEDHPFDYGDFEGTIPEGNYGAGEVRIFDAGTYEVLEQESGKLTFRLEGERVKGIYHMVKTAREEGKDEWLTFLKKDERPPLDEPPPLTPMLATAVREPFDDPGWIFEPKWDGVRTIAVCSDETRLVSRRGNDVTTTYPELARLHERVVAVDAVIDGEIVAIEKGRPSFERLQSRINLQNPRDIERAKKAIPVTYVAFDLLYLDGRLLTSEPIERRKEILEDLFVPSPVVQVSTYVEEDGIALARAATDSGLEGIVAKKLGCLYRPGRRSRDWLKIKVVYEADVVIGGWSRGEGTRAKSFGALLVGAYGDDGLHFLGAVGTGFDQKTLDDLYARLQPLKTNECPFAGGPASIRGGRFGKAIKNPAWAEPELVAKIEFRELTMGARLRAPSFKGLRDDKPPEECSLAEIEALRPE